MSQTKFFYAAGGPRTNIALIFFTLALIVLFSNKLSLFNKRLLFIVFSASCIVSHYSTSLIFLLVILLAWAATQIMLLIRKRTSASKSVVAKEQVTQTIRLSRREKGISFAMTILFFAMFFIWHSQVTGAPFDSVVHFIANSFTSLQEFFYLESRASGIDAALGVGLAGKNAPQIITFIFSWLTIIFIGLGVLACIFKQHRLLNISMEANGNLPHFLDKGLDASLTIFSIVTSVILIASVAIPNVFHGYGMDRAFIQMLVLLSPCLLIGFLRLHNL
jgi:uncharacterized membrane protein